MCEPRHDFLKDQHLYTLESPFIHSATDINQRSGPDRRAPTPAGECSLGAHSLSEGTEHRVGYMALIVGSPKGTIAWREGF